MADGVVALEGTGLCSSSGSLVIWDRRRTDDYEYTKQLAEEVLEKALLSLPQTHEAEAAAYRQFVDRHPDYRNADRAAVEYAAPFDRNWFNVTSNMCDLIAAGDIGLGANDKVKDAMSCVKSYISNVRDMVNKLRSGGCLNGLAAKEFQEYDDILSKLDEAGKGIENADKIELDFLRKKYAELVHVAVRIRGIWQARVRETEKMFQVVIATDFSADRQKKIFSSLPSLLEAALRSREVDRERLERQAEELEELRQAMERRCREKQEHEDKVSDYVRIMDNQDETIDTLERQVKALTDEKKRLYHENLLLRNKLKTAEKAADKTLRGYSKPSPSPNAEIPGEPNQSAPCTEAHHEMLGELVVRNRAQQEDKLRFAQTKANLVDEKRILEILDSEWQFRLSRVVGEDADSEQPERRRRPAQRSRLAETATGVKGLQRGLNMVDTLAIMDRPMPIVKPPTKLGVRSQFCMDEGASVSACTTAAGSENSDDEEEMEADDNVKRATGATESSDSRITFPFGNAEGPHMVSRLALGQSQHERTKLKESDATKARTTTQPQPGLGGTASRATGRKGHACIPPATIETKTEAPHAPVAAVLPPEGSQLPHTPYLVSLLDDVRWHFISWGYVVTGFVTVVSSLFSLWVGDNAPSGKTSHLRRHQPRLLSGHPIPPYGVVSGLPYRALRTVALQLLVVFVVLLWDACKAERAAWSAANGFYGDGEKFLRAYIADTGANNRGGWPDWRLSVVLRHISLLMGVATDQGARRMHW